MPEGTVKAHLFRARSLLRDKLKPMLERPARSNSNPNQRPASHATESL
jgi:hypothetical protein